MTVICTYESANVIPAICWNDICTKNNRVSIIKQATIAKSIGSVVFGLIQQKLRILTFDVILRVSNSKQC